MDSISHAFAISALMMAGGQPALIAPGILGAVIPDLDIVLSRIGDRRPDLYILTHGGITHSLAGGILLSTAIYTGATAFSVGLGLRGPLAAVPFPAGLSAALSGTLLHILLDLLAYPGIPLLYPHTDRKYTAGIFAGPSPLLLGTSAALLVLIVTGLIPAAALPWYGLFIAMVIAARAIVKGAVMSRSPETAIPRFDPRSWLLIGEEPDSFSVTPYDLFRGRGESRIFPKYNGIDPGEAGRFAGLDGVRRLLYHSYIVTVSRDEEGILFRDPVRDEGYIRYPFDYRRFRVPADSVYYEGSAVSRA